MTSAVPSVARPLVSVIVNCYNGERFLEQALTSILSQTWPAIEVIFWDNQSSDRSGEIAKGTGDPRVHYHHAPRHTMLYEARNEALRHATGEFVAFLDVDDVWEPSKLEAQIALFADPLVGIACGNYWILEERTGRRRPAWTAPMPTGRVLDALLRRYYVGMLTLMVRRSALEKLAVWCDPRFHVIGDLDLVIRLAVSWKLAAVEAPVATYRLHDNNETGRHFSRYVDEMNTWWGEAQSTEAIASSPAAPHFDQLCRYLTAKRDIRHGERRKAFATFRGLPWGRRKCQLAAALLAPAPLIRRLTGV